MPIPCPHFKITIVKRSQGQSAVAGAAYQSGERLFSEYDQKTKFYNKKKELVHAEIMLPSYAPPGYADRATLWNAVEAVENQWNSQLARRIVLAFPVEVPKEQYLPMLKEFCNEQFVSKGMIADFAIHDKGDGFGFLHKPVSRLILGRNRNDVDVAAPTTETLEISDLGFTAFADKVYDRIPLSASGRPAADFLYSTHVAFPPMNGIAPYRPCR